MRDGRLTVFPGSRRQVPRIAREAMSGCSFLQSIGEIALDENRYTDRATQELFSFGCPRNRCALNAKNMNGSSSRFMQLGEDWNHSHAGSSFTFDAEKSVNLCGFADGDPYSLPGNMDSAPTPAPKPKKFFKSRDATNSSSADTTPLRKFDLSTLYGPKHKLSKKPPKRRLPPPTKNTSGRKLDADPPPMRPYTHRSPPISEAVPPSQPANSSKGSWNCEPSMRAPLKLVMKKTASGFHVENTPVSPPPAVPAAKPKKERLLRAHEQIIYEPPPIPCDIDLAEDDQGSGVGSYSEQSTELSVSSRSARYARRAKSPKTLNEDDDSCSAPGAQVADPEPQILARQRSKSPRGPRKRANSGRGKRKRGGGPSRSAGPRPKKPSPPQASWESLLGADAVIVVPGMVGQTEPERETDPDSSPENDFHISGDSSSSQPEAFSDMMSLPESHSLPKHLESNHEAPALPPSPRTEAFNEDLEAAMEALHSETATDVVERREVECHDNAPSEQPVQSSANLLTESQPLGISVFPSSVPEPLPHLDVNVAPVQECIPASEPVPVPEPGRTTRRTRRGLDDIVMSLSEPQKTATFPVEAPQKRRGRPPKSKKVEELPALPEPPNTLAPISFSEPMPQSEPWLAPIREAESEEIMSASQEPYEPLRQAERIVPIRSRNPEAPIAGRKPRIFFSKSAAANNTKRASYKHKWVADTDEDGPSTKPVSAAGEPGTSSDAKYRSYDDFDSDFGSNAFDAPKLRKVVTAPPRYSGDLGDVGKEIVSLKCNREEKQFFTVVKNVRAGYQIQEIAEFQDFQDDIDYILESLKDTNPIGVRCLSAVSLASKCMIPSFRMHVRAQGTVANFFGALKDAPSDASLSLCTAMTFFVLAQDRLNMDLDGDSLNLMLRLIESNSGGDGAEFKETKLDSRELEKHRQKVREMCSELQAQGHAQTLDLNRITPEHLAVETLLSLTSRRAGEWFKEELRDLGGLDHIVNTVRDCLQYLPPARSEHEMFSTPPLVWDAASTEKLKRAERCLRVFQNVTSHNEDNQKYLLCYQNGVLVDCVMKLCVLSANELPSYDQKAMAVKDSLAETLLATLLSSMKVLLLLAADIFTAKGEEHPAEILGKKQEIFTLCFRCLFHLKRNVTETLKAELLILALGILIHLVERSKNNCERLLSMKVDDPMTPAGPVEPMRALIRLFLSCDANAKEVEEITDNIIDEMDEAQKKKKKEDERKQREEMEETINDLVAKAGKHMEETIIGANIALLLCHCIWDNPEREESLRSLLPEGNFCRLIGLLEKYFNFVKLTATIGNTGANAVQMIDKVLKYLKKRDELRANPEQANQGFGDERDTSWGLDDSVSLPLPDPDESSSADDSSAVDHEFFFSAA